MKTFIILAAVVLCACLYSGTTSAQPAAGADIALDLLDVDAQALGDAAIEAEAAPSRQKRATCDLLSIAKLGINHAACAANCIRLGYKGGWCNDKAVCNCRR
ncbi:defensin-like [Teleopsis dalmanni]|uniref:defensin-like n=1 Tax=Teleopsis dalmanni TaxID=139649 RepID=UPI0018CDBE40|nr:defensin-like [Teleopsis dalmanni]